MRLELAMNGLREFRKLLKNYRNRGVSMKVIKKPPQLDAVKWNGTNKDELERLMSYLVPGRFIIESLEIGDWVIVHPDGLYEIVADKDFDRLFERV